MEVILFFVLVYAAKRAWDDTMKGAAKSRQAYMARAAARHPGMPRSRQVAHAARHDAGHVLSQLFRGFPNARHGFASGWHEGRQAHAHARAEHQRAKAEHLETRASLIPDLTSYRARQKAALEQIRRGAGPDVKSAACGHAPAPCLAPDSCPCDCPDCMHAYAFRGRREESSEGSTPAVPVCWSCFVRDGDEHAAWCATRGPVWPDDTDGPTYSWGLVDAPHHWPAANREQAERKAQAASRDGRTHVALEYPPGGGQGRIVAAFRDDKPFGRSPDDDRSDDEWAASLLGEKEPELEGDERAAAEDHAAQYDPFFGNEDGHSWSGQPAPSAQHAANPTEGTPMASEVTYDGVIRAAGEAVTAAEERASEITRTTAAAEAQATEAGIAQRWADQAAENMQALNVDSATLGAMADHQDALAAAEKAHQAVLEELTEARKAQGRVTETAQNVKSTLERGHAGLSEAHKDAPVQAADRTFYEEG